MSNDTERIEAEGLGSIAITLCEMGASTEETAEELLRWWARLGQQPGRFAAAAESVLHFPQPLPETADETERLHPIRQMLGAKEPHEQLSAMLRAREILEKLATQYG